MIDLSALNNYIGEFIYLKVRLHNSNNDSSQEVTICGPLSAIDKACILIQSHIHTEGSKHIFLKPFTTALLISFADIIEWSPLKKCDAKLLPENEEVYMKTEIFGKPISLDNKELNEDIKACYPEYKRDSILSNTTKGALMNNAEKTTHSHKYYKSQNNSAKPHKILVTPQNIFNYLKSRVISQEDALKKVSVAFYQHYLRKNGKLKEPNPKPIVIMLAGQSGTGKTYISKLAAEYIKMPFVHVNSASLVSSGIVGQNLGDTLNALHLVADKNMSEAEYGIYFLDEVDKIFTDRNANERGSAYASDIQNELLMFLEGEKVFIHQKHGSDYNQYGFCTNNLLIILAGAFEGIEEIIAKRLKISNDKTIGYYSHVSKSETRNDIYKHLCKLDLIEYGFSKQLCGRISQVAVLTQLRESHILSLLQNDTISPIKALSRYFETFGKVLLVDDNVYPFLAKHAADSPFGVRYLNELVDCIATELKFKYDHSSSSRVVKVSMDFALKTLSTQSYL